MMKSRERPQESARLLRGFIALTSLTMWTRLGVSHFRGSFHNPLMYVPFVAVPVAAISGLLSALRRDERASRRGFLLPALAVISEGVIGTLLHLRGIAKEMGGLRNWKFNVQTGPPFPAPAQVALVGAAGLAASSNASRPTLARVVDATNALGYLLIATEAIWNHWHGYFYNKLMFIPAIAGPVLSLLHLGSLFNVRAARKLRTPLSFVAVLGGLVGFSMHIYHIEKRRRGFRDPWGELRWDNFFYGPPPPAPLQFVAYGVMALLTGGQAVAARSQAVAARPGGSRQARQAMRRGR